jgi:hypothetical protein
MLLWFKPNRSRSFLTESQETAQLIAKLGQSLVIA